MANIKDYRFGKDNPIFNKIMNNIEKFLEINEEGVVLEANPRGWNSSVKGIKLPLNWISKITDKEGKLTNVSLEFEDRSSGESFFLEASRNTNTLHLSGSFNDEHGPDLLGAFGIPARTDDDICIMEDDMFMKCPDKAIAGASWQGQGEFKEPKKLEKRKGFVERELF